MLYLRQHRFWQHNIVLLVGTTGSWQSNEIQAVLPAGTSKVLLAICTGLTPFSSIGNQAIW